VGFDGVDDGSRGVAVFRGARRRRIAAIAQAVTAVEPVGVIVGAGERFFGASEHGDGGVAEFRGVEGVAGGLRDGDVAGDGGDGEDVYVRIAESHDEGYGVVGGGVGVDQEVASHGRVG
jgi:hypothetical protein